MGITVVNSSKLFPAYKAKKVSLNEVSSEITFKNLLGRLVSSVEAKTVLKSQCLKDDIHINELIKSEEPLRCEDNYCSLCGSKIESDGSCPICIVPIFIHGTSTPLDSQIINRNVSQISDLHSLSGSKSVFLSKSSRIGRK